jgi:hypothetical protein
MSDEPSSSGCATSPPPSTAQRGRTGTVTVVSILTLPRITSKSSGELDKQDEADIVIVCLHPASEAHVSLLELGLCPRTPGKAIVLCLEGYCRMATYKWCAGARMSTRRKSLEGLARAVVSMVDGSQGKPRCADAASRGCHHRTLE